MARPFRGSQKKGAHAIGQAQKKARRRPTNLSLDPDAVARGERYGERHGTSLSQLVTSFLHSLPAEGEPVTRESLAPPVRRLVGLVRESDDSSYKAHLVKKYGSR